MYMYVHVLCVCVCVCLCSNLLYIYIYEIDKTQTFFALSCSTTNSSSPLRISSGVGKYFPKSDTIHSPHWRIDYLQSIITPKLSPMGVVCTTFNH